MAGSSGVRERPPSVAIAGAGLAGLSCALSLGLAGAEVTVYEANRTLGGKAGVLAADGPLASCPIAVEHGPHFLAGWYLNLRALIERLGLAEGLLDFDGYSVLSVGDDGAPRCGRAVLSAPSLRGLLAGWVETLRSGPLDWALALRCALFVLDLCSLPSEESLDGRSVESFIRSRWYGDEALVAEVGQQILRAVSAPADRVSCLSIKAMMSLWLRYSDPLISVLDEDLDSRLIAPLAAVVAERARIHRCVRVAGLESRAGALVGLRLADGSVARADAIVCATPAEVLRGWCAEQPQIDARLDGLARLRTAPMASFLLVFDRPLRVPPGVVHVDRTDPAINLIDLRATWRSLRERNGSVLSLVVSDFAKIAHMSDANAIEHVIGELESVLDLAGARIEHAVALPNTNAPFFLNTVGSWRDRPDPSLRYGKAGASLHVVGDYVRTPVNIACMESAVLSGLIAAEAICEDHGLRPGLRPVLPAGAGRGRRALYRLAAGLLAPATALGLLRDASVRGVSRRVAAR